MSTHARHPRRTLLILGALGLLAFGPGLWTQVRMAWQQRGLDRELRALQTRHDALAREKTRLTQDATYVEGKVRSTFKVAKPGEVVVPLQTKDRAR